MNPSGEVIGLSRKVTAATTALILCSRHTGALPIKAFRVFPLTDQATYIGSTVSMLAYRYAAIGNVAKAHCTSDSFFGIAP